MTIPPELTSANGRGALPMIAAFVRAYPRRSAVALIATFVAGLVDGLGMSMLLSMLSLATRKPGHEASLPEQYALRIAEFMGLPATPPVLLVMAIVLIALKAVLTLAANRQVGNAVASIATDLRLTLIRAVMGARWRHYLNQSVGRLSNAVATEASRASETFQYSAEMAAMTLNSIIYLIIAFAISWQVGLATALAGIVLLAVFQVLIRTSRSAGQHQTELLKSLLTAISSQMVAAKPLKAMAREDHVDALLSDQTKQLRRALRHQVVSREALAALQEPLLAIMVGVGFYVSLVVFDMPLASVLVMLFLLARVVNYLSKVQRAYQQVAVRESAYWSLMNEINAAHENVESNGGDRVVALDQSIRFDDVSYGHGPLRKIVEHGSFEITAGQLTVFIGPSGAGKTTLLDLVVGLLQPDAGRILVDGVPLNELDLRRWRRQIGYVPQDSVMVNESVAHNLTLGDTSITEDEIRAALRAADALDFVEAMPEGLQTRVGESGSRLSGGQRQRLAIARALVHKPRLLILDEATSNLDMAAQQAVVAAVGHLKGQLTILAVAHQSLFVEVADRVYRLADAHVAETGVAGVAVGLPARG
ncbi:ABC transporter ATP-binding protein [soil metagenome]